jgi:hypothetical protein
MNRIRFQPIGESMGAIISAVPAFPGDTFMLTVPESIGDSARACWPPGLKVAWKPQDNGGWRCEGIFEKELRYALSVTTGEDTVDVRIRLTNDSERHWKQSLSFNCFNCSSSKALNDYECLRHWTRVRGQFRRLIEQPRHFGPRPTIQLYSVEGAPKGRDIPFVANFDATPDVVMENWLAIRSRDGRRLAATVSSPTLFLFQNMEYSCIHSASSLGALSPEQTGEALLRLYFVEASLEEWYRRMRREMP